MTKSFDMTLNCKGTAHRPKRDHNSYKDNAHFAVPLLAAEQPSLRANTHMLSRRVVSINRERSSHSAFV